MFLLFKRGEEKLVRIGKSRNGKTLVGDLFSSTSPQGKKII